MREGKGQNEHAEYQPWVNVRDVSARGLSTRSKGWKTGRVHHFLSKLEKRYHYTLEWSKIVTDIREQYPLLQLEETLDIAKQCGFDHPAIQNKHDPKIREPIVMTTDFLVTLMIDGKRVERARTVKYADDLQSPRVLQKLEIERRYWEARGISWGIVTEHEIPGVLAANVEILYPYRYLDEDSRYSRRDLYTAATELRQTEQEGNFRFGQIALDWDAFFG